MLRKSSKKSSFMSRTSFSVLPKNKFITCYLNITMQSINAMRVLQKVIIHPYVFVHHDYSIYLYSLQFQKMWNNCNMCGIYSTGTKKHPETNLFQGVPILYSLLTKHFQNICSDCFCILKEFVTFYIFIWLMCSAGLAEISSGTKSICTIRAVF